MISTGNVKVLKTGNSKMVELPSTLGNMKIGNMTNPNLNP